MLRAGWMKPGSPTWCLSSLRHTAARMICSSSSSSAPSRSGPRRSVSLSENRQVRRRPSAVSRTRLQSAQNGSETGLMNPIRALPVGEPVDAGGGAGLARLGLERIHGLDRRADLGAGQHLLGRPGVVGVERHELDEADLVGVRRASSANGSTSSSVKPRIATALILIGWASGKPAERLDAAQHLGQRVAPGQLVEAVALQRVDRDVEAVDPGRHEAPASRSSRKPLVVTEGRATPSTPASIAASFGKSRRTSGSPPVSRTSPTPIDGEQRRPAARSPRRSGSRRAPARAGPRPACSTGSGSCSGR